MSCGVLAMRTLEMRLLGNPIMDVRGSTVPEDAKSAILSEDSFVMGHLHTVTEARESCVFWKAPKSPG